MLAPDRLSWTAFTALWVLWIWGEMESREFAAAVGISRPTATGVLSTLQRRRFVRRRKAEEDGRVVLVSLTPSGRRTIEALFPRFNAEEAKVAAALSEEEQERVAAMLRSLFRRVAGSAARRRGRAAAIELDLTPCRPTAYRARFPYPATLKKENADASETRLAPHGPWCRPRRVGASRGRRSRGAVPVQADGSVLLGMVPGRRPVVPRRLLESTDRRPGRWRMRPDHRRRVLHGDSDRPGPRVRMRGPEGDRDRVLARRAGSSPRASTATRTRNCRPRSSPASTRP